jgi:hypothetical protein
MSVLPNNFFSIGTDSLIYAVDPCQDGRLYIFEGENIYCLILDEEVGTIGLICDKDDTHPCPNTEGYEIVSKEYARSFIEKWKKAQMPTLRKVLALLDAAR